MAYDWNFSVLLNEDYLRLLGRGLATTISLTLWCIVGGTPLGVALGSLPFLDQMAQGGRRSGGRWKKGLRRMSSYLLIGVSRTSLFLIDSIRAIPLLLLMLTSYYVLPALLARQVDAYVCVVVAMSFNLAAFIADLVRGAAASVPRGDILAARGLGMGRMLTWRRIVLPEVFREILPGLTTLYITMMKMSTLASALTVYELLHSADAAIQKTYRPLEFYMLVCFLFLLLILPLSSFARRLERSRAFLRRS